MQTTLSSDIARVAEQDDCLKERLTVYETFMFYAHLRLPSHLTMAERRERVPCTHCPSVNVVSMLLDRTPVLPRWSE